MFFYKTQKYFKIIICWHLAYVKNTRKDMMKNLNRNIIVVFAQVISMLICLYLYKLKGYTILKFEKRDSMFRTEICKAQLKLGVPMGIQNIITSIGGLVVQSVVNGFGVIFIAAYTAATKLYGLLETAASSYSYAVSTYVGQNYGAVKIFRVRSGLRAASCIGIMTTLLMSVIMLFGGNICMVSCRHLFISLLY